MWVLNSLETTAGYLAQCPIHLAPGLNCIIGARGTCKSTIVETIRFVFDCDSARIAPMLQAAPPFANGNHVAKAGLILETLSSGVARCTLSSEPRGDATFVVERNIEGQPRVLREGVQQIDAPSVLHNIEIYSQGDLQMIAETPDRRLALIDRPNQARVSELVRVQGEAARELQLIGAEVRRLRSEIESRTAKTRDLPDARKRLTDVQRSRPALSDEMQAQREAHERRREGYERLKAALEAHDRFFSSLRTALAEEQGLREAAAFANALAAPAAKRMGRFFTDGATLLGDVRGRIDTDVDGRRLLDELASEFEQQSAPYYALRKEQQQANDSLKTEEALRHAISAMEAVENELSRLRTALSQQLARRAELRAQRESAADELYSSRLSEAERINREYGEQVVLTLQQGTLTARHRQLIEQLLQRSNLRNQSEVARDLAERVRPSDLLDTVEQGDAKRLAEALGRDVGQMTRLVSHLMDSPKLYELETVVAEDVLEITMVVRGEPKPIGQLSKGQMATALLPLILRDAQFPLVVDQPEDDLDNAYISERLVDRVRTLAKRRQLIFVTHNANIPVLGDAERVFVMEMSGPRTALPCASGTVDERREDIIKILEGGRDAFRSRGERYGDAVE